MKKEKQIFKLSPSSLNLFRECSRCFWLDKRGVWKRPSGAFPSLTRGMDIALKNYFDNYLEKGRIPPEIADTGCKLFNDQELLKAWRNNLRGIRWQDAEGNILFGAIDNLLTKAKKLVVLDYKTRGFEIKNDTAAIPKLPGKS